MKAISLVPGTTDLALADIPEPMLTAPDEVKVKVKDVGICGTDREEAAGGRANAPAGKKELIIGHEMFGQVTEVGSHVKKVKPGDYGVFTVRRGCGKCKACLNGRSDMCYTGNYTERGIKGADGYQAEYVVDKQEYFVKVPAKIKEVGVLTEPMSVAAKAIDEASIIQRVRLKDFDNEENWFSGKKALIAGIGPIGLMAAFALHIRGANVFGMDVVDENSTRPTILKQIDGQYINGKKIPTTNLDDEFGEMDFVFEATGIAELQIDLIDCLGINGIYVATGIPSGKRPVKIPAASLMQQLVLKNQVVVGSVNASFHHYQMAVADLIECFDKWPASIKQVITDRVPFQDFDRALHSHSPKEIKMVVEW